MSSNELRCINFSRARSAFLGLLFLLLALNSPAGLLGQQSPSIVVDVICGETCINFPRVYAFTMKEVKRIEEKSNLPAGTILLRKWTVPENGVPTEGNTMLNDEPVGKEAEIPIAIKGYGSPTVLINEQNVVGVPWMENGNATCAAFLPDKKRIRKQLRELLRQH